VRQLLGAARRCHAARIGIDPAALEATVARFNAGAAEGKDPDFDRHRFGLMGAAPIRPLGEGPYYAVAIHPGMLGTNGGPKVNALAQVVSHDGTAIRGLYAVGNTAANVFGWAYPSGGATIAHGVTFGFLAGRHAAAQPVAPALAGTRAQGGGKRATASSGT
jgi:succinate dehydrogenase/fumarate reductase flavoprotein subunit